MAYDKKYIEEGNDVGDYLNDMEDRIEGAFEDVDDITTSLSSDVNALSSDVNALNDFKDEITIRIYSQGVNFSGKTSNGGDLWIGNPGTNNALLVANLRSVNGQASSLYRISTYLNNNAAYIRLFDSSGAVVPQADVILNYVIYLL